jgi:hypothetical protein
LLVSPQTALLAPALSLARTAVVGVHGSPGTTREWLGAERFGLLTAALTTPGGPQVLVPGEAYVEGVAQELGLPRERISVLPNATPLPERAPETPPGMRSILAPMRLAGDKLWVVKAAARLAQAGQVPLTVMGRGPHAEQFRAFLASQDGLRAEVIESEDFDTHLRQADVVVAVGLVALEAAARGRRVAVAAKPGGGLAGALTPVSWATLQATNFAGLGLPEQPPSEVWAALEAMTSADLEGVVRLVERTASPRAMLENVRRHLRPVPPPHPTLLVSALGELADSFEQRLLQLSWDAQQLENARDWWHQQAQGAIQQLQDTTTHLREVEKARDWWHQQAQCPGTPPTTPPTGDTEKTEGDHV